MRYILLIFLLIVSSLALADWTVASLESRALIARVGSEDVLPVLNGLISPGMTRSEVERLLAGFKEASVSPEDWNGQYSVSYRYWFGLIPPFGPPELKLIGAVDVVYSKDWRVKSSHYWIN